MENTGNQSSSKQRSIGAQIITFLLAIIPFIGSCPTCPACFPIYSTILSLFGLKLADYSLYLLPVMLVSMTMSLRSMYLDITTKNISPHPFFGALISCAALLLFKYILAYPLLSYLAVFSLLAATIQHNRSITSHCTTMNCVDCKPKPYKAPTSCTPVANKMAPLSFGSWNRGTLHPA